MNDEILALLGKAEESFSAAELLFERGFYGFSASRAYYAMFYVTEALLVSIGQSYSSHGGVIGSFGREFAKTGKFDLKFHRWLIDAQDVRNIGDYGVGVEISSNQARELIAQVKEFIQAGRDYLQVKGEESDVQS